MIVVRCDKNVRPDVRAEVRRVARGFVRVSRVAHHIRITLHHAAGLVNPAGLHAYGFILFPKKKRSLPHRIDVAGYATTRDGRRGLVRGGFGENGAARCVGQTLLHELAHYEQWRDRRPMGERGVNVRAASLYRQIDSILPPPRLAVGNG